MYKSELEVGCSKGYLLLLELTNAYIMIKSVCIKLIVLNNLCSFSTNSIAPDSVIC